MVRLRMTRLGAKKRPFYRIVAADSRSPRDGRYIEQLGHYDPMKNPYDLKLNLERVDYWLGVGAQPSETVASLIEKARNPELIVATPEAKAAPAPVVEEPVEAAPAEEAVEAAPAEEAVEAAPAEEAVEAAPAEEAVEAAPAEEAPPEEAPVEAAADGEEAAEEEPPGEA
jgi:small subunit ribosomal protein S16